MIMPGMMVLPEQSMIFALAGIDALFAFPIIAILPWTTTSVWSFFAASPVPSTIFAWARISVSAFTLMNCFVNELNDCELALLWKNNWKEMKKTKQQTVLEFIKEVLNIQCSTLNIQVKRLLWLRPLKFCGMFNLIIERWTLNIDDLYETTLIEKAGAAL